MINCNLRTEGSTRNTTKSKCFFVINISNLLAEQGNIVICLIYGHQHSFVQQNNMLILMLC